MSAATAGWFVVHALWIGAIVGGVAATLLAAIGDRGARLRHALAYAGLMLMVVLPLAVSLTSIDFFSRTTRARTSSFVERSIGLPSFVVWRGYVVRAAAIAWTAGLIVVAVRVRAAQKRAAGLRRSDVLDPGDRLRQIVAHLRTELGVTRPVTLLASRLAEMPMVFGWRQSTILLPIRTSSSLDVGQLTAVIAHELAHVQRRDYALNLVQVAADVVLWFHPAARWLSRRVRIEREYCCDDVAVRVAHDAGDYARALATLEEARHDCPLVVAATSGTLLDRIQRIVGQPRPTLTPLRAATALVIAIAVGSAIATLAQVVPPGVPLNARLRTRTPPPQDGARIPASGPVSPRIPQR
jgi:bla regulator protein BlaR1